MRPNAPTNASSAAPQQRRLLDRLRGKIRLKHHSIRTEQAYVDWVRHFFLFHEKRHLTDFGPKAVETF